MGKSALLARLHEALTGIAPFPGLGGYLLAKFRSKAGDYYVARCSGAEPLCFSVGIEAWPEWTRLAVDPPEFSKLREVFAAELRRRGGDDAVPSLWCDAEGCLLGGNVAQALTRHRFVQPERSAGIRYAIPLPPLSAEP